MEKVSILPKICLKNQKCRKIHKSWKSRLKPSLMRSGYEKSEKLNGTLAQSADKLNNLDAIVSIEEGKVISFNLNNFYNYFKSDEDNNLETEDLNSESSDGEELNEAQAFSLFVFFLFYIAAGKYFTFTRTNSIHLGGIMLSFYEPDMDFFKAVYFNFVTLTSIGLGDIVPRR